MSADSLHELQWQLSQTTEQHNKLVRAAQEASDDLSTEELRSFFDDIAAASNAISKYADLLAFSERKPQ